MCGIAGFIDFSGNASKDDLENMTCDLNHRGPDAKGFQLLEGPGFRAGLAHKRLSIIDLSNSASQPMIYKNWIIVFNGEIYNYKEIKTELELLGHLFITSSDTEVILHAWESWGKDMVHKFIGMFAIVIYDKDTHQLNAFRDRAGAKPFYYYRDETRFLFGSELKAFYKFPGFKKRINKLALQQFMKYGYILAPNSIFEKTSKLVQGHSLFFDAVSRVLTTEKYWDVYEAYNHPKVDISFNEAKEETRKLLSSACGYRMVADVPVGVFLSGGYDSTAVTALLQEGNSSKLKTFSIGFHEEGYNEAEYAKQVARHLSTDHTEHYCTAKEAQEIIPEIPFYCDEPFGDSSIIPTILVSRLARKKVTVALSADGGDEVFGGYNKYPLAADLLKKLKSIPTPFNSFAGRLLKYIPDSLLIRLSGSAASPLKKERFAQALIQDDLGIVHVMDQFLSQVYSESQLTTLLNFTVEKAEGLNQIQGLKESLDDLDKMMAVDYKTYLADDILVKVDRAGMSSSLEGREPLLDHRLIEYVARLPVDFKINNGVKKYLLKEIVHDYVPDTLMDRPKMGFGVPVFDWLRGDLRSFADEYMNQKAFEAHGLFKTEGVQLIINEFYKGNRNYNTLFWYLLMFQMWYKKWME